MIKFPCKQSERRYMAGPHTTEVTKWVLDRIEHEDEVSIPIIYREAMEAFPAGTWRDELLREMAMEMFRKIVEQAMSKSRPGGIMSTSSGVVTVDAHNRKATVLEARLVRSLERSGGKHKRVGVMRRADIAAAISERRERVQSEMVRIEYLEWIFNQLPDDDTTVEEVLSEVQLREKWNELQKKYKG